jgi:hypothetical protein
MAEYSKEFLDRVAKAHRSFGFNVKIQSRKGKQYLSLSSKNVKAGAPRSWTERVRVGEHMKAIFPSAYVTSGLFSGGYFEITFRINP